MAFLFGSAAKGRAIRRSDLDIAVHFSDGYDVRDVVSLAGELERLLGRDVDVIVLNSAPATLARTALRGVPLVIRNRQFYMEFMLDVSREAEDFDQLTAELWELRRRRRAGLEAIPNGR
jgi:predicted nucleotidyltransferase